jgi:hypothetical protein
MQSVGLEYCNYEMGETLLIKRHRKLIYSRTVSRESGYNCTAYQSKSHHDCLHEMHGVSDAGKKRQNRAQARFEVMNR